MSISSSANSARLHFTATSGQTAFSVSFEFFDNADLDVYVNGTQKTITTHYTVSGGDGSTGTVTFNSGLTLNDAVTITRRIDIERVTDFSAGQAINRAALNTQLDTLTAISSDNKDRAERSLRAPDDENAPTMTLPSLTSRKGTVLGFNATSGNVEAGPKIADVSTLAAVTADIATLADIEDGTDATDAIQTVAGIASNVSTVAGVSSAVSTVAGISSNVTAVAADATDIGVVAGKATEIGRLGTAQAVADLDILATTDAVSDMNTLAAISSNISTVAGISANVTSVAGVASLITSDFVADLNTLATTDIVSDLNTLATADIVSDLNTLATSDIVSDLNTLATSDIVSDMNLLATSDVIADMAALAGSGGAPNISTLTITKNSGTGILPALTILCSDTTAIQNQDLGKIEFQTSDSNEAGTVSRIVATKTNSTSASTNEAALEFYTGRPNDLSLSMTINADHTVSFANNINASGTVTATGTSVFASLDISGDIDVDGTTNLDATNIVGALDVQGTITSDGLTVDGTGGQVTTDNNGHITSKQSLDSITAGGRFIGKSNRGLLGQVKIEQTATGSDGGYIIFETCADGTQTPLDRLKIAGNGDISFYEDTGTTAKFFWDASAESLGVGTSSPSQMLTLSNGTLAINGTSSFASNVEIGRVGGDNNMAFATGGTERMRIDTSGDLTVKGGRIFVNESDNGNTAIGLTRDADEGYVQVYSAGSITTSIRGNGASYFNGGNVGIGTDAPQGTFVVQASNAKSGVDNAGSKHLEMGIGSGGCSFMMTTGHTMSFGHQPYANRGSDTNFSEAMRIDSSGNLLVGTTSTILDAEENEEQGVDIRPEGFVKISRSSNHPLQLARTDDGEIVKFRSNETTVGSIGVSGGNNLYIGSTASLHAGLTFATRQVLPNIDGVTLNDGGTDLGNSSNRFRDLYLSGGVYLGGTGSANNLDDYEEGTWTPTYATTGTGFSSITHNTQTGQYTKVGQLVTVRAFIRTNAITLGSASGVVVISGLPFTSIAAPAVGSVSGTFNWAGDVPSTCVVFNASSLLYLYYRTSANVKDDALAPSDMGLGANNNDLYLTLTYLAA